MPPATRNPLQSSASEPKNFHAVHARMCTSWGIIGSRRPLKGQLVLQALPPVTMPRYFHGVVSRFSAGRRSLSLGDRQAVTSFLQRSDISFQGIQQFLGGEGVTNVGDRHKLVAKVGELLDPKRVPAGRSRGAAAAGGAVCARGHAARPEAAGSWFLRHGCTTVRRRPADERRGRPPNSPADRHRRSPQRAYRPRWRVQPNDARRYEGQGEVVACQAKKTSSPVRSSSIAACRRLNDATPSGWSAHTPSG